MAGKGDSDAMGGVNSGFGVGAGTWRVTGQEGLEGGHGELLGIEDDVSRAGAEEPISLEDLQRETARALFTGARGGRAGRGTQLRSAIGSMQGLFSLRDRIRANGVGSPTGRQPGNRRTADGADAPPRPGPAPETDEVGARLLWYAPRSLTAGDSLAARLRTDDYEGSSTALEPPYTSYLYRVDYLYDSDHDGVGETFSTYMRVYVPTQTDLMVPFGETSYGVVLLVDGGGVEGVGKYPGGDKQFRLADALAEGKESLDYPRDPERLAPPMVVITFTLPGRYSEEDDGTVV